jgi:hypothetical protein
MPKLKLKRPSSVRFELSVRARLPVGALTLLRKEVITEAVERWIESGEQPDGWIIKLTIWTHGKGREIREIGSDERGERLREVIRARLQSGALQVRQMGNS